MKKKNEILYLILFLLFPIMITSFDFLNNTSSLMMQTDEALLKPQIIISQKSSGNGWLPGGTPINVEDSSWEFPRICSDGTGGAIISWSDRRSGSEDDIYAQRIDSSGNVIWTNNGVLICSANDDQFFSQICSDGAGGAIITWADGRRGIDIYAQRINSTGDILWTPNGTAICTATGSWKPQICSDGAGGAIIAWQDSRPGSLRDIYAQRIDSSGNFQWTPNGTVICSADNYQWAHQICSDGAGGAIITWYDDRYAMYYYDIFAQLINSSGDVQWTPNGIAICTATGRSEDPQLCSNGAGGAIITWSDIGGIYAQLINSNGNTQWTENGTSITKEPQYQIEPQLCSDGAGGAIITWIDRPGTYSDIYAQHINSSGNLQWVPNGTVICSADNYQWNTQICSNGAGGAIITWDDKRVGGSADIYAQSINSSGNVQLITNGKVICSASHDQFNSQLCYDGAGGAIITWADHRSGDEYHIYAQHINYEPTEPEDGEIPFEIIIAIASIVGIAVVIGVATTLILKKRRKIE